MITNYKEFVEKMYESGFSMGNRNADGVYSIASLYAQNIHWHTDDAQTDPWEWRMRVLEDNEDIAYSKVFFKKSGFITKEWYPYFLAVRRPFSLEQSYNDGLISNDAKKIYDIVKSNDAIALHMIKAQCNVTKASKSQFESALTELQMKMYITMCGRMQKISADGKPYGWFSTMFCLSENYFDKSVFDKAKSIDANGAIAKITQQIYKLNPDANPKKIPKFISG